jgi:hypothetical protein
VPDDIASHQKRNAELAALIREKGASLEDPRVIECHFWVPSRDSAEQLVTGLEAKGLVKLRVARRPNNLWNVEMAVTQSVNRTVRIGFTTDLINTAEIFGGKFDGWGTSV